MEKEAFLTKLLSLLRDFKTPIQFGALCVIVFFLIINSSYDVQFQIIFGIMICVLLLITFIPELKKTSVQQDIEKRKIDANLERGKHWTDKTMEEMTQRTFIESIQRKQGALDVYNTIIVFLTDKIEEGSLVDEQYKAYQDILKTIISMKTGLNSFPLGFHEQVMKERKEKRGRFKHMNNE